MTERGTKTLIGAFVLSALALLIVGIMLVGSGSLFSRNMQFVLYFSESLRGLAPGSPVYFKGVPVGKVMSIQIAAERDLNFDAPVIIEMQSDIFAEFDKSSGFSLTGNDQVAQVLVRRGLRARLGMLSVVTGQLSVDLDIFPDAPPVDPEMLESFRGIPQIPTMPATLTALLDVIDRMPVGEIANRLLDLLRNVDTQVAGLNLPALTNELRLTLAGWSRLSSQAETALTAYSTLARHVDVQLVSTLHRVSELSQSLIDVFGVDSATVLELNRTMQALREASQAITNLAVLLEMRPESLIFGRVP